MDYLIWSTSWLFYLKQTCIRPALQLYQDGQYPVPDPTVTLCFGEELHDLSSAKSKLIIVQVRAVKKNQNNPMRASLSKGVISIHVDDVI